MSSVETGQMSAFETGHMSVAATGQMSSVASTDICFSTHNVEVSEVPTVPMLKSQKSQLSQYHSVQVSDKASGPKSSKECSRELPRNNFSLRATLSKSSLATVNELSGPC